MIDVIEATFQDGVFKPDRQPVLSENTRVRLVIETSDAKFDSLQQQSWDEMEKLWRLSTFTSDGNRLTRDELHERD